LEVERRRYKEQLSERDQEQEQGENRKSQEKSRGKKRREEKRNGLGATFQPTKTRQEPSRTKGKPGCDKTDACNTRRSIRD
jgi:hypothetical protein